MVVVPKSLKAGDTIGLICPSGYMPLEKAINCINTLKQWGYKVKVGETVGARHNYFSGSDEFRLSDIQRMLDDDDVKAILCARGGYGLGRIIDEIDFNHFRKKPKWIIGFSDITVLHAHVFANYKIASLHAPMAGAFNESLGDNEYVDSLKQALLGMPSNYFCPSYRLNKTGKAKGVLIGGNLSLVTHLIGTSSAFRTKGKILFLEDVGEYIYNIDRMMYQLDRGGFLKDLTGLIVGGFTELKDTVVPFGQTAEEAIHDVLKKYTYPVCYQFPVSHNKENFALKVGVRYELIVTKQLTCLAEKSK